MPGSCETEKIKHLPIPRNHKDLVSLERKRKKDKKVLREKNSPREIKMGKVKKGDYGVYLVGAEEVDPTKFVEGRIPLNVTKI